MNPRLRDHQVRIDRASTTINGHGEQVQVWAPLGTTWGAFAPVSDGEQVRAAQVQWRMTARFTVPWGMGATTRDRLVDLGDNTVYEIVGTKTIARRKEQELTVAVVQ